METRQSLLEPILKIIKLKIHVLEQFYFDALKEKNLCSVLIKNTINSLTILSNNINYYFSDSRYDELYTVKNIDFLSRKIYQNFLEQLDVFGDNLPGDVIDKLNEAENINLDLLQESDLFSTQFCRNIIIVKSIDEDEQKRIINQIILTEKKINISANNSVLHLLFLIDLKRETEAYLRKIYSFPNVKWTFKKGTHFNEHPLMGSMLLSNAFTTFEEANVCFEKIKKLEHVDNIKGDEGGAFYGIKIKDKYRIMINLGLNIQKTHESVQQSEITIQKLRSEIDIKISNIIDYIVNEKIKISLQSALNDLTLTLLKKVTLENYANFCNQQFLPFLSLLSKCAEKNLLNTNNLTHLTTRIISSSNSIDKLLDSIIRPLSKLKNTNLLVQSNIDALFYDKQFTKSCNARVYTGRGLRALSSSEQQIMWGYYCVGVESTIENFIKEGRSLKFIFDYARESRSLIAKEEEMSKYADFSCLRSSTIEDQYSNDCESIVDPKIFDSLWTIQEETFNEYKDNFKLSSNVNAYTGKFSNISSVCCLPQQTVIMRKESNNIARIITFFSPQSEKEIYEALDRLDEVFLKKMDETHKNIEKFLLDLGSFTFHLVRLYPTIRGTGAMMQWIIRGIIKNYTNLELGDVKLGSKNDIPYDVYAHLVQNPIVYANSFKEALLPLFQAQLNVHKEKNTSITSLNFLSPALKNQEEKSEDADRKFSYQQDKNRK